MTRRASDDPHPRSGVNWGPLFRMARQAEAEPQQHTLEIQIEGFPDDVSVGEVLTHHHTKSGKRRELRVTRVEGGIVYVVVAGEEGSGAHQ